MDVWKRGITNDISHAFGLPLSGQIVELIKLGGEVRTQTRKVAEIFVAGRPDCPPLHQVVKKNKFIIFKIAQAAASR